MVDHITAENSFIQAALNEVEAAPSFPSQQIPGSLVRQRKLVAELQAELDTSPISEAGEGKLVLEALRYAASLKDPLGFVGTASKEASATNTGAAGRGAGVHQLRRNGCPERRIPGARHGGRAATHKA